MTGLNANFFNAFRNLWLYKPEEDLLGPAEIGGNRASVTAGSEGAWSGLRRLGRPQAVSTQGRILPYANK